MKNYKIFVKNFTISIVAFIPLIAYFNYIVDPYGLYNTTLLNLPKIKQSKKIMLVKAIKTREIKPISIVLGTSRTEFGYDPTHRYFQQPSYNLATSGSSIYQNKLYFQNALKQGNLKNVLLVADYRMFNNKTQKSMKDIEEYFTNENIFKYIFSVNTIKDSLSTIFKGKTSTLYLENGQMEQTHHWNNILRNGGHHKTMQRDEAKYYKDYSTNYTNKDTKNKSFPDFEEIVKLCYKTI